jgi:beta-glucosidase
MKKIFLALIAFLFHVTANSQVDNVYVTVINKGGPVLGYSPNSGVKIISKGGLKFKDLNKNG